MYSVMRNVRFAFCLLLGLHVHALYAATLGAKIALVIGNSEYTKIPRLKNASGDALAVARALSDKGFTVFLQKTPV
jgi:hypothetical protein